VAADADSGRAEEAKPSRRLGIRDIDEADLRLDPQLHRQPLDDLERAFVVRAAVEVKNLHERSTTVRLDRFRVFATYGLHGSAAVVLHVGPPLPLSRELHKRRARAVE